MERIIVLGTGSAGVKESYNTCFVLCDAKENKILVDSGGGNGILKQLEYANVDFADIHDIFITHRHADHILGVIWVFRKINILMKDDKYDGTLNIYCHKEVADIIRNLVTMVLRESQRKYLDDRIFINIVEDKEVVKIYDYDIEFFDVKSKTDMQFGFKTTLNNGEVLVFCGDEAIHEENYDLARGCSWLLHEALCLESEKNTFMALKKNHHTVEMTAKVAQALSAKNLVLWHSRENLGVSRKEAYINEAREFFSGTVFSPNDFDVIEL